MALDGGFLRLIEEGWGIQQRALESEAGWRLPSMEQAHQSYVTGFLSGLLATAAIEQREFEPMADELFRRRDAELGSG